LADRIARREDFDDVVTRVRLLVGRLDVLRHGNLNGRIFARPLIIEAVPEKTTQDLELLSPGEGRNFSRAPEGVDRFARDFIDTLEFLACEVCLQECQGSFVIPEGAMCHIRLGLEKIFYSLRRIASVSVAAPAFHANIAARLFAKYQV
jgi:hypothetical protein